jgi:hypothetical protein
MKAQQPFKENENNAERRENVHSQTHFSGNDDMH